MKSEESTELKVVQAAHEEQELMSAVLDTTGALVVVLDTQGRIVRFNRACERTTGYFLDEIRGRYVWELFLIPEEVEPIKAVFEELRTGAFPNEYENYWLTRNGEARLIAWSNTALLDERGLVKYVIATGIDVTERRKAEQEIRFQVKLLDAVGQAVTATDLDGCIIYWNRFAEALYGWSAAEVSGRHVLEVITAPDARPQGAEILGRLRRGESWTGEFVAQCRDGSTFPAMVTNTPIYDTTGRLVGTVGVSSDITERVQAEAALAWESGVNAALAQLSRALISSTPIEDISWWVLEHAKRLTHSPLGFVGYIDPQTGYFVSSTMTREVWDICQVADKDTVFKKFGGLWGWVLQHHEPLLTNQPMNDPRASGTPEGHIPIHRFLSAPATIGDTLLGQIALANSSHDYTERDLDLVERLASLYALAVQRQRDEEMLRRRTADLEARNEELDAFAQTVAHDLKDPLGFIVGYAYMLEEGQFTLPDKDLLAYLNAIVQSGLKMSNIIDALLLLASVRTTQVERELLDMASIVAEAQERLARVLAEKHAEIILPTSWPAALGYGPWVEEVWVNYISNAVKYGGRPPRVELGAQTQENGAALFWVRDNGGGIKPEDQASLFTPFSRLDQVRAEGHGLGLSIVRRIAEKLGGKVGVMSEMGKGSTFTFTLPTPSEQ